ncbi:hypothetical protein [Sphingopyxis fribergensis]
MNQAPPGYPDIVTHRSPDGRTVLDMIPGYDARDIHEAQIEYRPKVTHDGTVILNLAGEVAASAFEWQAGGALKLDLASGLAVLLDPGQGVFSTSHDGWARHPIADANAAVHKILNPDWDHDPTDFRRKRFDWKGTVFLLLIGGALAGLIYEATQGRFYRRSFGQIDMGEGINAWSVTCPNGRHVAMFLDDDDTLSFERAIKAAPLRPVDGIEGRYDNGKSVVQIEGTNATIWFEGLDGEALHCRGG